MFASSSAISWQGFLAWRKGHYENWWSVWNLGEKRAARKLHVVGQVLRPLSTRVPLLVECPTSLPDSD
jgi:hypothetical protein